MATTYDEIDLPPRAPRAWRFLPEEAPKQPRRKRSDDRNPRQPTSKAVAWLTAPWTRLRANLDDAGKRWSTVAALVASVGAMGVLVFWANLVASLPAMDELQSARFSQASILYTRFTDNSQPDEIEVTRYPSENREWVVLDSISPYVVHALVDTEDRRFYEHNGVDVKRLVSSTVKTLGGDTQGGSTITMQFARNRFQDLTKDNAVTRKFKEWILAYVMEGLHTKNDILEMYLNEVPFLYNAYGIQQASKTYFNKNAVELRVDEAATLVGMLKATSQYNPVDRDSLPEDLYDIRSPIRLQQTERSMERRNTVMRLMSAAGDLSDDSLALLAEHPTVVHFKMQAREDRIAPYFVDAARREFEAWAREKGIENLNTAGYRVYTTLDPTMQEAAQEAVRTQGARLQRFADRQFGDYAAIDSNGTRPVSVTRSRMQGYIARIKRERGVDLLDQFVRQSGEYYDLVRSGTSADSAFRQLRDDGAFVDTLYYRMRRVEASFVAIEPVSRKVRAYVGGRGYGDKQFDHVGVARRQPGSTFKPFVYAAALESKKFTPNSPIRDAYSCRESDGQTWWRPLNSGGSNGGTFSVRDALKYSKNGASVNLMMSIGRHSRNCAGGEGPRVTAELARGAGLTIPQACVVPSLALGICEQTLLQMANGYATIADYGLYRKPRFIERITDRDGNVVADFSQIYDEPDEDVIDPIVSYNVIDMMRGVIGSGTGQRLNGYGLGQLDIAGKTGTTQHGSDGWFMAITRDLVMGAWVGFDSPSIAWASGDLQQGSRTALPIVGEFIRSVRAKQPDVLSVDHRFERPQPRDRPKRPLSAEERLAQRRDSLRRDSLQKLERRRRAELAAIEAAKTPEQRAAEAEARRLEAEQLEAERQAREEQRRQQEAERAVEPIVPEELPPVETPTTPAPADPEQRKQEREQTPTTPPAQPKEKTGGTPPGGTSGNRPPGNNRR